MLDTQCLRREGVTLFVSLPDLQRGQVAPVRMFPQPLAVVEGFDEGEDLGSGGGSVKPRAGADLLFEYGPEALRGGVVEAAPGPAMLCRYPNLLILSRSCPEVYSDPRSLWITQPGSRRSSAAAMSRASTTSSAR